MLKLIAIGSYYLSIIVLVMGLLGMLELIVFPPIAGVLLFLIAREVSELTMAFYASSLDEE